MIDLEQEKQLVERAKNDTQAFGELYEQYYPPIFGYALRRTASVKIAQDVTSEVFLKAFKRIGQFEWRDIPFSAWLYRIASHEIANQYKKNKHQVPPCDNFELLADSIQADEGEFIVAEAEMEKYEEFLEVHAFIARLPVQYQEIITLRFFEDKKFKEIAVILGKQEGTVKAMLYRALEKLRKMMQ
jgi:RNA polymerase sigma-70 factor (ECF subfamily)